MVPVWVYGYAPTSVLQRAALMGNSYTGPKPLLRGLMAMHSSWHGPAQPSEARTVAGPDPFLGPSQDCRHCHLAGSLGSLEVLGFMLLLWAKPSLQNSRAPN